MTDSKAPIGLEEDILRVNWGCAAQIWLWNCWLNDSTNRKRQVYCTQAQFANMTCTSHSYNIGIYKVQLQLTVLIYQHVYWVYSNVCPCFTCTTEWYVFVHAWRHQKRLQRKDPAKPYSHCRIQNCPTEGLVKENSNGQAVYREQTETTDHQHCNEDIN